MAYLNKAQYDYRREAAAARNLSNEEIAVHNGMTSEQAELISKLCAIRHEFHCNIDNIVKSADNDSMSDIVEIEKSINESGLPELDIVSMLLDIDDLDGLIYEYGNDVPEDHDSQEFQDWYDDNYARISNELEGINKSIEKYLSDIDAKYGTHWCPTGALRLTT
jgi:spore coat protein CotH|nr:MAG TPA: Cpf1/RNA Complex FUNCTION-RNA complex.49A [Bacteriophage sp.]